MRIAMLGVVLDPKSRSTNIARTLDMIDRAAGSDPGPDLIAVPCGCDDIRPPGQVPAPAMVDTYRALLSAKAREWGVYLVAGHQWVVDDALQEAATLMDADGDDILIQTAQGSRSCLSVRETVIGGVGVLLESQWTGHQPPVMDVERAPEITVVFGRTERDATPLKNAAKMCRTLADETGSFVCLVRPARTAADSDCFACSDQCFAGPCVEHPGGLVRYAEVGNKA